MQQADLKLDGSWELARFEATKPHTPPDAGELVWIHAYVPGSVHQALQAARMLENPLASQDAAVQSAWVAGSDWLFRRSFSLSPDALASPQVELLLDSVDTFSDIWLNGQYVGCTDNMFRRWRFPLNPAWLQQESNELLIHLKSHNRMVAESVEPAAQIGVSSNPEAYLERSLVRRYQRSYNGSLLNMGQAVVGIGIPQSVKLCFLPSTAVHYACLVTDALEPDLARVHVELELTPGLDDTAPVMVRAALLVDGEGAPVAQSEAVADGETLQLALEVPYPRLWWPRGYGEAHLYTLHVQLERDGELLHTLESRVGLKRAELITKADDGCPAFGFRVNGRRIYVRGGNLMPLDAIQGTADMAAYERLLQLVIHGNMNLIRIWGGGITEREEFLARCDELGIMIWQDFFYHSCTYPDHLDAFVAQAQDEARDLVRTVRPHASLVMLCGGNEQQQGWDEWHWKLDVERFYGSHLFNDVFPAIVAQHAGEIPYIPNSPHGGIGGQSPALGDTHTWGSLYNATKDPLFVTETCWHLDSYSRPETLAESMGLDVDAPAWCCAGWHRRWRQRTGLGLFTKYPYSSYHEAPTLRDYLHGLEIEHLEADYQALSLLRVRSPSCSGIIYWPLNKGGPLFGFGAIDYSQRPLMGHFGLRRLFADVVLSIYRDADAVRIMAANDGAENLKGTLDVVHLDVSGEVLGSWQCPVHVQAGARNRLMDLPELYHHVRDRTREMVYVELMSQGQVVARDRLFFCPLSEVVQPVPGLQASAQRLGSDRWRLQVQSLAVVKLLCLTSERRLLFEDNYFTLLPGEARTLEVWVHDEAARDDPHVTVRAQDAHGPPITVALG